MKKVKRFILLLGLLSAGIFTKAQTPPDSIACEQSLQEVVVLAPNMERMDNYILVLPDASQRRHSGNAYELLRNCFIPGVMVDMQTGNVEAMGAKSTLYMNGQPCDVRDLMMLRPRDIEKIEYHDIPDGKYSNDRTAINFLVKQYRYGGYVLAKAQQTIGFERGIDDLATTINHGRNTYSVFAGLDYMKVSDNEATSEELFRFDTPLTRQIEQESVYKRNGQYVQLRHQYQGQKNYLTTKMTLVNTDMPYRLTLHTDVGNYRMNDPIFQFSFDNVLDFEHGWVASADAYLTTKGNQENFYSSRNNGVLNVSLTKSLMNDRLSIRIQGNDLFHTEKQGMLMYAGQMQSEQTSWSDSREFVLTLRYKFNTTRSKYKGTGAGNDEKNRL